MRTSIGTCQRKARFRNEAAALAAVATAPFPLRPYRCELCRQFHLTSRTKGMRVPRFEIERRAAAVSDAQATIEATDDYRPE